MAPRSDTDTEIAAGLRAWARGLLTSEAAVELIIRAHGGRLLHGSWVVREPDGWTWLDTTAQGGYLSGGERRLLDVVMSLASDERRVSLSDVVPGIDGPSLVLVLAAIRHAAGGDAAWPRDVP